MIKKGKVIIIPDDDKISDDYFEEEVIYDHVDAFNDFSKTFNLGYNFTYDDFQNAPVALAKEGHLVIKTLDDLEMSDIYIPNVVTDRQFEWFTSVGENMLKDMYPEAYSVYDNSNSKILMGINDIKNEIAKKNMLYMKEGIQSVGKEI